MVEQTEKKSGISLCMIVKNEEACLCRAVESVRPVVDEVIIVDTGSTDKTLAVAEQLGARVFSLPWQDDFSHARNFSLCQAEHQWILVLDADELIAARDLEAIKALSTSDKYSAAVFLQRNYSNNAEAEGWTVNASDYAEGSGYAGYSDVSIIRLFHNFPSVRYEGVVHEVIDESLAAAKKKYLDIPIHHFAREMSAEIQRGKSDYYGTLLMKDFEARPHNARTCFLLGRHYHSQAKQAEAIVFLKRAIDMGLRSEIVYENLGSMYCSCGLYQDAIPVLEQGLAFNPRHADLLALLGIAYYETEEREKAVAFLEKSITFNPASVKGHFNLGSILYREKNYAGARNHIHHVVRLCPQLARARYLMFFILYQQGEWDGALHEAQTLEQLDSTLYGNIQKHVHEILIIQCQQQGKAFS
jgi:glycosyltransferase involved in cell wall biosynthesis